MNINFREVSRICAYLIPAIFFIAFFIIFVNLDYYRIRVLWDSDINWILKTGEYIFTNMNLPTGDIYSYTHSGKEWVVYQWLFEVLIYLAYCIGNYQAIGSFTTVIFALSFTILLLLLRRMKVHTLYCIIALGLGAWCASATWYSRPAMFTYLFVCILLLLFNLGETKNKVYLWFIPPVFILWANMHLGFTFGSSLLIAFLVFKLIEYLLNKTPEKQKFLELFSFITVASLIGTLINPYGYKLYTYMINLMNSTYMNNNIKELHPPDFHLDIYYPMLILVAGVIILSHFQKRQNLFYLICLAITTCMTLTFVRNIPFFAIFATLVFALELQGLQEYFAGNDKVNKILREIFDAFKKYQDYEEQLLDPALKKHRLPLSLVVIIAFLLLLLPFQNNVIYSKYFRFTMDYTSHRPVKAYQFVLKHKIPGRFYTHPTWGSYAIHKLYPDYKVFIDTRFDMYGEEFFKEAHKIKLTSGNWHQKLIDNNVNWIILPVNTPMVEMLQRLHKDTWLELYKDKTSIIFIKDTPENHEWFKESGASEFETKINKKKSKKVDKQKSGG